MPEEEEDIYENFHKTEEVRIVHLHGTGCEEGAGNALRHE